MERDNKSIQEIMEQMITLLETNDEQGWANHLKHFILEYKDPKMRIEAVKNILNIYKGGMGSFTDLVLQKNFKMLVDDNNQLAALKHDLYNSCLEYCTKHHISIE